MIQADWNNIFADPKSKNQINHNVTERNMYSLTSQHILFALI